MIGFGLKKMAKEAGLKLDQGVAYGDYMGYAVTLSEGAGYKFLGISTKCTEEQIDRFSIEMEKENLDKEYRITDITIAPDGMQIVFYDNPGTMRRYRDFVKWFFPKLKEWGFPDSHYCPLCGQLLDGDSSWKLNNIAFHAHNRCIASYENAARSEAERAKNEDTGNYGTGFAGAILGSLLGAIPWAIVLYMGYVASIMGLLISFLARKGYELFHGKNGKGKIAIVIIASVVGVIVGNLLSDAAILVVMIQNGELYGAGFSDIPSLMAALFGDPEYVKMFLENLILGLVFAFLGMIGMIRQIHQEDPTRVTSVKNLK